MEAHNGLSAKIVAESVFKAIWANHTLRASVSAMQTVCQNVAQKNSVSAVEPDIASVKEIFRLQNCDELITAEKKYFLSKK